MRWLAVFEEGFVGLDEEGASGVADDTGFTCCFLIGLGLGRGLGLDVEESAIILVIKRGNA